MKDWLDGYEHLPIEGCTGPGTYIGAAWKQVLHTTESGRGSTPTLLQFFKDRPCYTPHFLIDPWARRKVQFIRLSWSAAALAHPSGWVETNRANAIQTEIVGRAAETHTWDDDVLAFLGEHVADLVRAGVPLDLVNHPRFVGAEAGTIAVVNSPYRMSAQQWLAFDGVCGHQHVPGNEHWDPGRLDIETVLRHARGETQQAEPAPAPDEEDEMKQPVVLATENGKFLWDGANVPVPVGDVQIQYAANLHGVATLAEYPVNGGFVAQMRLGLGANLDVKSIVDAVLAGMTTVDAKAVADELARRLQG